MKTSKTQRTDPHRPGAIIPADYDDWNSYSLASGPVPPIGVDCAQPYVSYDAQGRAGQLITPTCPDTGRCCVASSERAVRAAGLAVFGAAGKCGVCGAHFVYGSMFKHSSGDLVHMGHDCADKYGAMYDSSAWEIENGRTRAALAKVIARTQNDKERQAFLDANPGLEADLAVEHRIITDIAAKFTTYRSLSEKQVALVRKLADEVRNPKPVVEELHAAAPTGKGIEFEGEIVGAKVHEGEYGTTWKMTVKVTTDAGTWLAWGTVPEYLATAARPTGDLRAALIGRRVSVKATLEAGRDSHFVFMKRPSAEFSDVHGPAVPPPPKAPRKPRAKKQAEAVAS